MMKQNGKSGKRKNAGIECSMISDYRIAGFLRQENLPPIIKKL